MHYRCMTCLDLFLQMFLFEDVFQCSTRKSGLADCELDKASCDKRGSSQAWLL